MALHTLGIVEAVAVLASGQASAEELAVDCLGRVDEFDSAIEAWAWLDRDFVLNQARSRDKLRMEGKSPGRLHGVPIGIKDIIDTAHIPTEYGCELFSGRTPGNDACIVERLKQEGAVIMGKTVTAELAGFAPGKTRNPHNPEHTPGGSSSGSAAAVASFMSTGAIGTQTNGSVIRPASFCGVVGFKPGFGQIPRHGILRQSPFLDQVGVFARSVQDTALLAEVLIGPHPADDSTRLLSACPPLTRIVGEQPPLPPRFGLVKTARWDQAGQVTRDGLEELAVLLGEQAEEVTLPAGFDSVWDWLQLVNEAEMATWYKAVYDRGKDKISDGLKRQIESGMEVRVTEYLLARAQREQLNIALDDLFQSYDALITPAAIGEAPRGLETTGNPVFCTPWTFCGVPTISLPLLQGENELPVGVQLVGQAGDDARLLRTANWLQNHLGNL